jgi:hypothetical protein
VEDWSEVADDRVWRVGDSYSIHVYAINQLGMKDDPVCTVVGHPVKAQFLARQIVREHNAVLRERYARMAALAAQAMNTREANASGVGALNGARAGTEVVYAEANGDHECCPPPALEVGQSWKCECGNEFAVADEATSLTPDSGVQ